MSTETLELVSETLDPVGAEEELILPTTVFETLEGGAQGVPGPTGYGLLGYTDVPEATPMVIDLALPVSYYLFARLTANRTFKVINGSPQLDRKRFLVEVQQDGIGSRTLTAADSSVGFGTDLSTIDLSPTPYAFDTLGFIYRYSMDKAYFVAINHGS